MAIGSHKNGEYDIPDKGLSLRYSVFCIVDMVGLFPVIALPKAIINCGKSYINILINLTYTCV